MYKTIPIQYLDQWLEQGYNGRIIDLRSPSSYCQGHISGAENYPFDELMDDPDLLDGSCPLLFYCTREAEHAGLQSVLQEGISGCQRGQWSPAFTGENT